MGRRKKGLKIDGWVNLDKPLDITSTQALGHVRRILNAQKAGHAGTLDPMASGILPIALGEATKTIPFIQDATKTYTFTVKWGSATDTDDAEGNVISTSDHRPSKNDIENVLPHFIGEITQTPPQYSAVKINGQRAYDLARAGHEVEIKSRIVHIESLKLLDVTDDTASFETVCGKGTYIRSIARDMAEKLNTCGHVITLRREAVGAFATKNAISLDLFSKIEDNSELEQYVMPLEAPLDDIPAFPIFEREALRIRNGQQLALTSKPDYDRLVQLGLDNNTMEQTALATLNGRAVALLEITGPHVKPIRVFNV